MNSAGARRVDPAPVAMQSAGGNQGVDVQVRTETLTTDVQHQRGGDAAAERARILAKLDQGVGDCLEQQPVQCAGVRLTRKRSNGSATGTDDPCRPALARSAQIASKR